MKTLRYAVDKIKVGFNNFQDIKSTFWRWFHELSFRNQLYFTIWCQSYIFNVMMYLTTSMLGPYGIAWVRALLWLYGKDVEFLTLDLFLSKVQETDSKSFFSSIGIDQTIMNSTGLNHKIVELPPLSIIASSSLRTSWTVKDLHRIQERVSIWLPWLNNNKIQEYMA